MNFLNSISPAVFEAIGTLAGLAACTVLLIQIIKEYKNPEKSSMSMAFIVGWIFIYLFWELYGIRFNAIAMYITNAIAIVLQVTLLIIVKRKNVMFKKREEIKDENSKSRHS